jgi:hypothetical protein
VRILKRTRRVNGRLKEVYVSNILVRYADQNILKDKAVPLHATEALGVEKRYSSYSFSTSALDGDEWSASRPDSALAPGKGPPVRTETGVWVGPREIINCSKTSSLKKLCWTETCCHLEKSLVLKTELKLI